MIYVNGNEISNADNLSLSDYLVREGYTISFVAVMEQRVDHMKYMEGMEALESNVMDQVISKMEVYDSEKYKAHDVLRALKKNVLDIEDFAALLSPAAFPFLENMAKRARLNEEGIEKEMQCIASTGLQEILLLTGESRSMSDVSYIAKACKIASPSTVPEVADAIVNQGLQFVMSDYIYV